ncbi:helix-turn-helix transcriptional regulator [Kitasatospora sp. NPDC059327]|uniref:helix-turn-helix transcriptional regulator n=1 Tax=Kitasatospora sp. NPDC059327 TaxID=3346803 RepID=UPI00367A030E
MALTTLSANSVTDEHLEVLRQLLDSKNALLRRHGLDAGTGGDTLVQLTHELPASAAEWLLGTALERGTSVSDFLTELVERSREGVPAPRRETGVPTADGVEWFSVQQLAEATGTPLATLYGLLARPDGPNPVRVGPKGGRFLVHRLEAERFARSRGRALSV